MSTSNQSSNQLGYTITDIRQLFKVDPKELEKRLPNFTDHGDDLFKETPNLNKISEILKTEFSFSQQESNWELRITYLKLLRYRIEKYSKTISNGIEPKISEFWNYARIGLSKHVEDIRSQVQVEACVTVCYIFESFMKKYPSSYLCEHICDSLFNIAKSSKKSVASLGSSALIIVLQNSHSKDALKRILTRIESKNTEDRLNLVTSLQTILQSWPKEITQHDSVREKIQDVIKKGQKDPNPKVRKESNLVCTLIDFTNLKNENSGSSNNRGRPTSKSRFKTNRLNNNLSSSKTLSQVNSRKNSLEDPDEKSSNLHKKSNSIGLRTVPGISIQPTIKLKDGRPAAAKATDQPQTVNVITFRKSNSDLQKSNLSKYLENRKQQQRTVGPQLVGSKPVLARKVMSSGSKIPSRGPSRGQSKGPSRTISRGDSRDVSPKSRKNNRNDPFVKANQPRKHATNPDLLVKKIQELYDSNSSNNKQKSRIPVNNSRPTSTIGSRANSKPPSNYGSRLGSRNPSPGTSTSRRGSRIPISSRPPSRSISRPSSRETSASRSNNLKSEEQSRSSVFITSTNNNFSKGNNKNQANLRKLNLDFSKRISSSEKVRSPVRVSSSSTFNDIETINEVISMAKTHPSTTFIRDVNTVITGPVRLYNQHLSDIKIIYQKIIKTGAFQDRDECELMEMILKMTVDLINSYGQNIQDWLFTFIKMLLKFWERLQNLQGLHGQNNPTKNQLGRIFNRLNQVQHVLQTNFPLEKNISTLYKFFIDRTHTLKIHYISFLANFIMQLVDNRLFEVQRSNYEHVTGLLEKLLDLSVAHKDLDVQRICGRTVAFFLQRCGFPKLKNNVAINFGQNNLLSMEQTFANRRTLIEKILRDHHNFDYSHHVRSITSSGSMNLGPGDQFGLKSNFDNLQKSSISFIDVIIQFDNPATSITEEAVTKALCDLVNCHENSYELGGLVDHLKKDLAFALFRIIVSDVQPRSNKEMSLSAIRHICAEFSASQSTTITDDSLLSTPSSYKSAQTLTPTEPTPVKTSNNDNLKRQSTNLLTFNPYEFFMTNAFLFAYDNKIETTHKHYQFVSTLAIQMLPNISWTELFILVDSKLDNSLIIQIFAHKLKDLRIDSENNIIDKSGGDRISDVFWYKSIIISLAQLADDKNASMRKNSLMSLVYLYSAIKKEESQLKKSNPGQDCLEMIQMLLAEVKFKLFMRYAGQISGDDREIGGSPGRGSNTNSSSSFGF